MRRSVAAGLVALSLLTGCDTPAEPAPPPLTSQTPALVRDFTVATTEIVHSFDPAAARTTADSIVAYNSFQRLMTANPGEGTLRPDAASDCLFESPVIYRCTLRNDLRFVNGDDVRAEDVKFSVLRAFRLGSSTSAAALSSLDHIDTPDDKTVRFYLKWTDNQFGYALAAPTTSIVDARVYDSDAVRPNNMSVVGSGPYQLSNAASNQLLFEAYRKYVGFTPPGMTRIALAYYKDSAAVEDAMAKGLVDMTWRGLSAAARKRLLDQVKLNSPAGTTSTNFRPVELPGSDITELVWNPASGLRGDGTVRSVVATALQGDRTLDSLLPPTTDGHTTAFPLGGTASIPPLTGTRQRLTLGYSSSAPDAGDLANRIRDRLEQAGISVQLLPDSDAADLRLVDSVAWVNAPLAYLLPYLSSPLPGSAQKLGELEQRYRGVTEKAQRDAALSEIQKQAGADLIVLPIAQDDGALFLSNGVTLLEPRFGPGWQLGLWSIRK